ncbi:MAG TPA: hypothetical protein VGI17_13160 [Solirubrobacterales bacterium]|jgi:hypothetical protein
MKALRVLLVAAGLAGILPAGAQAAPAPQPPSAAPALKVLGITAPTHLPQTQSEVQRVAVEAEGGTFQLRSNGKPSVVTPVVHEGLLTLTGGSTEATINSTVGGAAFEVGDRLGGGGLPFPFEQETFVVACSTDCKTPGSTVTLSVPAEESITESFISIYTNELTVEEGELRVGDEIETEFETFVPGTVVTSVEPGKATLSRPPGGNYFFFQTKLSAHPFQRSGLIAFNAPAATVQEELESLPAIGQGSVRVEGGPGGDSEHPYLLEFGGSHANQDIPQLSVLTGGLQGPHAFAHVFTVVPGGPGTGQIVVLPANVGGADTSGLVTVHIGPLPIGVVLSGPAAGTGWNCTGGKGDRTATCTNGESLRSLHSNPRSVHAPLEVQSDVAAGATAPVEISGGGVLRTDTYQVPIVVSAQPAPFGVAAEFAGSFEADGSPSTQAGGHPYDGAAYFMVNSIRTATGAITPAGDSRDVVINLPPGFIGNPLASKRCPQSTLLEPEHGSELCNAEMTVGNLDPLIGSLEESLSFESHLYNDVPPRGFAAEFSTKLLFPLQSVLANINAEEDFGIRLTAPNNANLDKIYGAFTAFEGVPAHGNGQALLTNPTNCAESAVKPPVVRGKADTYQETGTFSEPFTLAQPTLTDCQRLEFNGVNANGEGQVSFTFQPTSGDGGSVSTGSTPVGATAHLHIDQGGLTDPRRLATPELKRAVIKLPEGLSLNPSSANGLEGCSETQIGYKGGGFEMPNPMRFNKAQPACPDGSKLGTAEIKTPLLENPLAGTIYLANQEENPFGSLLAIYLVVNDPLTGVLLKLPGEVQPDPTTGRLTTVFDNNPQLPFEDLELRFRGGGPQSEFATSEVCGTFPTEGEWTPWSAPESGPPAQTRDSLSVTSNCASSPGARPFSPSFEAGTTGSKAGAYAPLVIKVDRKDGEQELTSLNFTLPKGLIGKLAGIPYCSDSAIAEAEHKTGKQEQASPSCPGASQVGSVDTSAGVGSEPFHVGGHVYLAGPYKGAPVSSVVITPAVAGPLDLGNVVVRAPLYVDHETTELTAKSDPIPTILRGIPLKVRSVAINVDKPGFILNPTNCTSMTVSASIGGGSGATSSSSNHFQVAGCKELGFAPKLKIALKGGTKRAKNPALTATLTQPSGQANIHFVSVALPHSEFLEQGHIRTVCTRVQFAAEQCPAAAIYGEAEAVTPLLDQPLKGPVYLRSSSHRLPDLVAQLRGPASQPIEVDLDGRIDSLHGGIRTTFESVPDAPVSKFVLRMQGGKKGLIVNSTNICQGSHRATAVMEGQNGKPSKLSPVLQAQCGKKKKSAKGTKKPVKTKK